MFKFLKKIYREYMHLELLQTSNIKLISKNILHFNVKNQNNKFHLDRGIRWLLNAQEASTDGGVSKGYSLLFGWQPSYPETSGYIIPTLLEYYQLTKNEELKEICKTITNWLVSIQLKNGGFQGGEIGVVVKPSIFASGQILLGLIHAYRMFKEEKFRECAIKTGNFLLKYQQNNGNWVKFTYNNIPHTYNIRTAWALLELFKATDDQKYFISAKNNINWAKKQTNKYFWFYNNSSFPDQLPLLHFISYTIRGFLESSLLLNDQKMLDIAYQSSKFLLEFYRINKKLPASFNHKWESKDTYVCLTGVAQLSIIWQKLSILYKENRLFQSAIKLNQYLKSIQIINDYDKCINGAIQGSYPIWGDYARFRFPNWATKFYCDALILESKISL